MVYARVSPFVDVTADLAQAIKAVPDSRMFGFCTDDNMPNHILANGHLDYGLRGLIAQGIAPVKAIQMATLDNAQHYGLWGLGGIAPGWYADLVLLDDLEGVHVRHVITAGKLRVQDGKLLTPIAEPVPPLTENSVHLPDGLNPDSFIPTSNGQAKLRVNAINLANLIITQLETLELPCENGRVRFPLPEGVALAAVVGRHGQNRPPSLAFVTGYPIQAGAIASTVSHDSHNLAVIGKDPGDIYQAARALAEFGGGLVAVKDGQVFAKIPLPVAGLMSTLPAAEIGQQVSQFEQALPTLGLPPFFPMTLLAMALPVIPTVRLTDLGIVDIMTQQFVPFEANA
jgi:adenine deaminase